MLLLTTPLAWSNSAPHTRPAAWATPLDARLNIYRMDQGLYRSALPQADDQPLLQQLGVKTVINFYQRSDAQWLNAPGIHQVHLPLRTDRSMVAAYALVIAAAVLRLAALLPTALSLAALHASAAAWVLAFALYLWRFAPLLVRPRADRQA